MGLDKAALSYIRFSSPLMRDTDGRIVDVPDFWDRYIVAIENGTDTSTTALLREGEFLSDLYLYHGKEGIVCCGCRFGESGRGFDDPAEILAHLHKHREAGHALPDWLLSLELWQDALAE